VLLSGFRVIGLRYLICLGISIVRDTSDMG